MALNTGFLLKIVADTIVNIDIFLCLSIGIFLYIPVLVGRIVTLRTYRQQNVYKQTTKKSKQSHKVYCKVVDSMTNEKKWNIKIGYFISALCLTIYVLLC